MFRDERGQATVEYALVLVAAAAVAISLIVWAASTGLLPSFFNTVARRVTDLVREAPVG